MPMFGRRAQTVTIRALPERRPFRWWQWLLLLVFLVLLSFGGWRLYVLGGERAGFDRDKSAQVLRELNTNLLAATTERDELRRQVINLERSTQIDQEAARNTRAELMQLQEERQLLREEIELLKKLLSDSKTNQVLRVTAFTVVASENPNEYRFELTATRLPETDQIVSVKLDYAIAGMRNGELVEYPLADLDTTSPEGQAFEFKQIGRMRGTFVLPDDFQPELIKVTLTSTNKKILDADWQGPWQLEAVNGVTQDNF